jgi:hypothetical protein
MVAYVHRRDSLVFDQEFEGDAVRQVDEYRVQSRHATLEWMQAQRGVERIGPKQFQRLQVLLA